MIMAFELMGVPLRVCSVARRGKPLKTETDLYKAIKQAVQNDYEYYRVENKLQNGFPDITLISRYGAIWMIEAKYCRKSKLTDIKKDLTWQPGQLAFMHTCLKREALYALVVYHAEKIYYFTGEYIETQDIPYTTGRAGLVEECAALLEAEGV